MQSSPASPIGTSRPDSGSRMIARVSGSWFPMLPTRSWRKGVTIARVSLSVKRNLPAADSGSGRGSAPLQFGGGRERVDHGGDRAE